jgi:Leucine-rich repeat (LRR) protein
VCETQAERMRGFNFCYFLHQKSKDQDVTRIKVNESMFHGGFIKSETVTAIAIAISDFDYIPKVIFTSFGNITRLKIWGSVIKEIRREDFQAAPYLRVLEILDTKVKRVSPKAFELAKNLKKVKIDNCEINDFSSDAFDNLEDLKVLVMKDNVYKLGKQPSFDHIPNISTDSTEFLYE